MYHNREYWNYFTPIRGNMPHNCSADVEAIIAYVDTVLTSENTTAIDALKASFGMSDLSHLDDFAGACACPGAVLCLFPSSRINSYSNSAEQSLGLAKSYVPS
jgi:hypothetical protein